MTGFSYTSLRLCLQEVCRPASPQGPSDAQSMSGVSHLQSTEQMCCCFKPMAPLMHIVIPALSQQDAEQDSACRDCGVLPLPGADGSGGAGAPGGSEQGQRRHHRDLEISLCGDLWLLCHRWAGLGWQMVLSQLLGVGMRQVNKLPTDVYKGDLQVTWQTRWASSAHPWEHLHSAGPGIHSLAL